MTPELTGKAQRMYDARTFTMAEPAASCGVTPMTICRNISIRPDGAADLDEVAGFTGAAAIHQERARRYREDRQGRRARLRQYRQHPYRRRGTERRLARPGRRGRMGRHVVQPLAGTGPRRPRPASHWPSRECVKRMPLRGSRTMTKSSIPEDYKL